MCEPRNRDNGASDVWALTVYCGKADDYVGAIKDIMCEATGDNIL